MARETIARPWREILTFGILVLVLTLIIDAGVYVTGVNLQHLDQAPPEGLLLIFALPWAPGIAAILTRLIYHRTLRGAGWGWTWGKTRYQLLSYLLPVGSIAASYLVVWVLGLGAFDAGRAATDLGQMLGMSDVAPGVATALYVALGITLGALPMAAMALGEEIGWRGFLLPALLKVTTFRRAALVGGVVWALWHYPMLLLVEGADNGTPVWYRTACFTALLVALSVPYAWIRLRSGSLWPAVIMHASHNAAIYTALEPLTRNTGPTPYYSGENGIVLVVIAVAVALAFLRLGHPLRRGVGPEVGRTSVDSSVAPKGYTLG